MKATELRLGNLIFCKMPSIGKSNQEKAAVVDLLEDETIGVTGSNFSASSPNPKHFEGIPLTDGWLKRFGFVERNGVFNKSRRAELGHDFCDFAVSFYDDTQLKVWRGDRYIGIVGSCGMVHQFQNLFFALNAIELTIEKPMIAHGAPLLT